MTTWADIQRLAADLQRVQFSDSAKKLSEANCIEVVGKLIGRQLIDVVFTRDGRSYVTNKHLETEVKNEVEALGGRVSLTDIASALNIDFDHVDRTAKHISRQEEGYILSNGEFFAQEYVAKLRRELEKLLSQDGARTVAFLCKHWDLSQDLLKVLVLDKIAEPDGWTLDGDTIYTGAYLQRHNNILSAVLLPLTKPTPMSAVIQQVGLPQKRFWTSFDELINRGEIAGRLLGSRTSSSCTFVPRRYDEAVKKYALTNFKEREYLELATLRKLGLSEAKQSIQQVLEISDFELLPTVAVSRSLLEQFQHTFKESLSTNNGVCDVQKTLQGNEVPLEMEDIDELCRTIVKTDKSLNSDAGFIFSSSLLSKVLIELGDAIETNAQKEADRLEKEKKQKGAAQTKKPIQEEDDDWGEGKKGKKKGGKAAGAGGKGKGKNAEEDKPSSGAVVVDSVLLQEWLRGLDAVPEELTESIGEMIHSEVNKRLRTRVADLLATMVTGDAQSEKKKLAAIHAKAKTIYDSICSLEASTSKFSESLAVDLSAHIIKTLGAELVSTVLSYASGMENADKLTEKQRDEVIAGLPSGPKDAITELYDSVKAADFEKIYGAIERVSARSGCALDLRPPGDKAIASWTENYVSELKSSAQTSQEPAATLLSTVLLLLARNGRPTAASGKFVQRLIGELEDLIPKGVVTCIKNKNDDVAKEMLSSDIKKLTEEVLSA